MSFGLKTVELAYLGHRLELISGEVKNKEEKSTIRMSFVLTGQLAYLGKRLELIEGEVKQKEKRTHQNVLRSEYS
jgi:hypothetical protein